MTTTTAAAQSDDKNDTKTPPLTRLQEARGKLISIILARAATNQDRYADLRSRCRTPEARQLIAQVCEAISAQESAKRVYKRRALSEGKITDAVERLVGDLLRARAGTRATGRVYHALGRSNFTYDSVKYDMFLNV